MLRIKHKEKILQHEHIEVLDCAGIAKPGPTRQLGEKLFSKEFHQKGGIRLPSS